MEKVILAAILFCTAVPVTSGVECIKCSGFSARNLYGSTSLHPGSFSSFVLACGPKTNDTMPNKCEDGYEGKTSRCALNRVTEKDNGTIFTFARCSSVNKNTENLCRTVTDEILTGDIPTVPKDLDVQVIDRSECVPNGHGQAESFNGTALTFNRQAENGNGQAENNNGQASLGAIVSTLIASATFAIFALW